VRWLPGPEGQPGRSPCSPDERQRCVELPSATGRAAEGFVAALRQSWISGAERREIASLLPLAVNPHVLG